MKFEMKLVKSTKNTHVYGDDSDEPIVPTIYVRKTAFEGQSAPKSITVEITENE